jgi:hypothetical protein
VGGARAAKLELRKLSITPTKLELCGLLDDLNPKQVNISHNSFQSHTIHMKIGITEQNLIWYAKARYCFELPSINTYARWKK